MNRVNVFSYDDDGGRRWVGWFDLDAAVETIDEDTRWDGNRHVSVHNIDKHDHLRLIRTKSGDWVLDHWSQWEGRERRSTYLTDAQALEWLSVNNSDDVIERYFGEQEEGRGPGRPSIGGKLPVTDLGEELLARVKAEAALDSATQAATVRALLTEALTARDQKRQEAAA